jgi:hypothetical protein
MSEQVEWRVLWEDEGGVIHNGMDGAQSMFGLTRAKDLAKKLGPPWQVKHRTTLLTPDEHAPTLKTEGEVPAFGSQWSP